MNSWKSRSLEACLPPLIRFTSGTGSTCALAFRRAYSGTPAAARAPARGGERDAEDRVRAEPRLVRRSRRARPALASSCALVGERAADERVGGSRRSRCRPRRRTPKPPNRSPPSRSSARLVGAGRAPRRDVGGADHRRPRARRRPARSAGRGSRAPRGPRSPACTVRDWVTHRITSSSPVIGPSPAARALLRFCDRVGEVGAEEPVGALGVAVDDRGEQFRVLVGDLRRMLVMGRSWTMQSTISAWTAAVGARQRAALPAASMIAR